MNRATSNSISAGRDHNVRLSSPTYGQIASTVRSRSLFRVVDDVHLILCKSISVTLAFSKFYSSPKLTFYDSFSANLFSMRLRDLSNRFDRS